MAEFVPYWMGQAKVILAGDPATPVPFGRLADDPGRSAAIERDRLIAPDELWRRIDDALGDARRFTGGLTDGDLARLGMHPRRGPVTVGFVLHQFIVVHLEEHTAQLERLGELA